MHIEFISGMAGTGKTRLVKEIIKESINEKNIIVIDYTNEYKALAKELNGSTVSVSSIFEFDLFEFDPGEIRSGPIYEDVYQHFLRDLAKTIVINLYPENKFVEWAIETALIQSALSELYECVGITNTEYKPKVENASDCLNIDLLIRLIEEMNPAIAEDLKKSKKEFLRENEISYIFSMNRAQGDFKFHRSFNVLNLYRFGNIYNEAVIFATISKAIRKAKLSAKPILFVVDEAHLFCKKRWFQEIISEHFENDENIEVKITTQSLSHIKNNLPSLLDKADKITLFSSSPGELERIKNWYGLSTKEMAECLCLEVGRMFNLLPKKKELIETVQITNKIVETKKKKFGWKFKMFS